MPIVRSEIHVLYERSSRNEDQVNVQFVTGTNEDSVKMRQPPFVKQSTKIPVRAIMNL